MRTALGPLRAATAVVSRCPLVERSDTTGAKPCAVVVAVAVCRLSLPLPCRAFRKFFTFSFFIILYLYFCEQYPFFVLYISVFDIIIVGE